MNNQNKIRWNVLSELSYVYNQTKGKKLKYEESKKIKKSLQHLQSYFGGITENQVIILCAIIGLKLLDSSWEKIYEFLDISKLDYLKHNNEIEDLDRRGLLEVTIDAEGYSYNVPTEIVTFILRNQEIEINNKDYDSVSFVTEISSIIRTYNENINFSEKIGKAKKIENKNINNTFIKNMLDYCYDANDRFCFYLICSDYVKGYDSKLQRVFNDSYNNRANFEMQNTLSGSHPLMKHNLIDFVIKGNVIDSTLTLTEKGKHIFLAENEYLYERKLNGKSLILPETIISKPLFYSHENKKQIDMLYSSVQRENLISIQEALRSKGMPTGICILLHGAPGTGKTESVYQIAKATNRQIVHVDISKTKSCWFGESEQKIEQIFIDYKNMCQKVKVYGNNDIPILLFNEADAILQKRTNIRGSSVEKTENAMQNILLENMEKFEGILIATTNLADNLDAAFERRFLFKIKFDNPTVEAKTAIWKSKLEWLPENQAQQLANEYNFSGGEIDNVVRKATMEEILTGSKVTIDRLEELCSTEKLNNTASHRMGFCM